MNAATTKTDETFVEMVAGIATEARNLAAAHADQMKAEMALEMTRARSAAIILATGVLLGVIGVVFVLVAFVPLLVEKAGWPEWAAWFVEGAVLLAIAGTVLAIAVQRLGKLSAMPKKSLLSIHESLKWISNN